MGRCLSYSSEFSRNNKHCKRNIFQLAKNRNIAQIAARLKDAVSNDSGKNIARDIVEMTYAV